MLRDENVPNMTNNLLPAHNNGTVIGMICEDKEFGPDLKAIVAIVDVDRKPRATPKKAEEEKKNKTTHLETEKKEATPVKEAVLYVPRGRRDKQLTLSPPKTFELNMITQMYVPKGLYVMRGPTNPPRLSELVVVGRAPQRPMTTPTAVP